MGGYQGKRALLVDDQRTVTALLRAMLEKLGFHVDVAHDGEGALTLLDNQTFDLVLSDIKMAPTNGIMLTKRLRESETHRGVSILLMTGDHSPALVVAAKRVGANDVLPKPFAPAVLAERLGRLQAFKRAA